MAAHSSQRSRQKSPASKPASKNLPEGIILRKPAAREEIIYSEGLGIAVEALTNDLADLTLAPRSLFFGNPGLGKSATVLNLAISVPRPFWWVGVEDFSAALATKGAFD